MTTEPFSLFEQWLQDAHQSEPNDPEAMALATADAEGRPSVRMVLLKGHGPDGFVFYTNRESRKAGELEANPHASLLFHWKSLRRQIRIEGSISQATDAESDAYFATRSRDSQIGAWASDQSRPLSSRAHFMKRVAEAGLRFAVGTVPRPPHWGGYRLVPHHVEFWNDKAFRLHERRVFSKNGDGAWTEGLLFP